MSGCPGKAYQGVPITSRGLQGIPGSPGHPGVSSTSQSLQRIPGSPVWRSVTTELQDQCLPCLPPQCSLYCLSQQRQRCEPPLPHIPDLTQGLLRLPTNCFSLESARCGRAPLGPGLERHRPGSPAVQTSCTWEAPGPWKSHLQRLQTTQGTSGPSLIQAERVSLSFLHLQTQPQN